MDMSLSKLREMVKDREAWHAAVAVQGHKESDMTEWTTSREIEKNGGGEEQYSTHRYICVCVCVCVFVWSRSVMSYSLWPYGL